MKTLLPLILMMLTTASAQEVDATAKAIRAVIEDYENSVRANTMKIIEAKTEEEKNKHRATVPSAEPCAKKVLKIFPKDRRRCRCSAPHMPRWTVSPRR